MNEYSKYLEFAKGIASYAGKIMLKYLNQDNGASYIVKTLLSKKLVAGSQISQVRSKYWWHNRLEECYEYN